MTDEYQSQSWFPSNEEKPSDKIPIPAMVPSARQRAGHIRMESYQDHYGPFRTACNEIETAFRDGWQACLAAKETQSPANMTDQIQALQRVLKIARAFAKDDYVPLPQDWWELSDAVAAFDVLLGEDNEPDPTYKPTLSALEFAHAVRWPNDRVDLARLFDDFQKQAAPPAAEPTNG